jgi:hypothetical protein
MSTRRHRVLKCLVVSVIVLFFVGLGVGPQWDQEAESAKPKLDIVSHHPGWEWTDEQFRSSKRR